MVAILAFLLFALHDPSPVKVGVLSVQHCGSAFTAVTRVDNTSTDRSVLLPLSPFDRQVVHNTRVQVRLGEHWIFATPPSDLHPDGFKRLRPGTPNDAY